jgi:hypothetical protein
MAKNDKTAKLAVQLLPNSVWEMVKPLIPSLRQNPKTTIGRAPVPHREALSGILYVLRMGQIIPFDRMSEFTPRGPRVKKKKTRLALSVADRTKKPKKTTRVKSAKSKK